MLSSITFRIFSEIIFSISCDIFPLFTFYYFNCTHIFSYCPTVLGCSALFSLIFSFFFSFFSFFSYPMSPQRSLLSYEIQKFVLNNLFGPVFKFPNSFLQVY